MRSFKTLILMFTLPPSRIPRGSAAGMEGSFKSFLRSTILLGKVGGFIFLNRNKPREEEDDEAERAENSGNDPKTHGNLRFRPAQGFEVVMQRRREKDFFPTQFFAYDLNNNPQRLDDKDDREKREEKRSVGEHCDNADHDTERHRTGISHKKLCRVDIEPQERKKRPHNRRPKRRKVVPP